MPAVPAPTTPTRFVLLSFGSRFSGNEGESCRERVERSGEGRDEDGGEGEAGTT